MFVHRIVNIAAVVLIVSLLPASGGADDGWRRTAQGWEQVSAWERPPAVEVKVTPPLLHPLHLAAIQVIASTLVLAFFTPNRPAILRN